MKSPRRVWMRGSMLLALPLSRARLRGDRISFTVIEGSVSRDCSGRVHGNTMDGAVRAAGSPDLRWSASRR